MTRYILHFLLRWHLAIVPIFLPSVGGIHNAQESASYAPRWHHVFNTGKLEQPDGVMILYKGRF